VPVPVPVPDTGAGENEHPMPTTGTLFLVGTPIGNLADLTPRALDALRHADLVAAEDTRVTGALLARHGIRKPLLSCHEHNERERADQIAAALREGRSVALATDAGSPGISDPGYPVVRAAITAGATVVAVPGPCAALVALQVSGLPTDSFTFLGFVPKKSGARARFLEGARKAPGTAVMYVPARDTAEALEELARLTAPGAAPPVAAARELTKLHEEVLRGPADEVARTIRAREQGAAEGVWKGEVTLVVGKPRPLAPDEWTDEALAARLAEVTMERGGDRKAAVKQVREETGVPRARLYDLRPTG